VRDSSSSGTCRATYSNKCRDMRAADYLLLTMA
jgi:hypothetical protein